MGRGGREGAKQPLVRLSWPVNQAGLDYHIWTTLLQPSACSSFASLAHKKMHKGQTYVMHIVQGPMLSLTYQLMTRCTRKLSQGATKPSFHAFMHWHWHK